MTTCQKPLGKKNENCRKMNFFKAYADRLKTASFIGELGGWRPFWWGRVVQTFVPAGGGNGKAIMILNVTPLAIRANAEPHTDAVPQDHMLKSLTLRTQIINTGRRQHNNADLMEIQWTQNSAWNQNDHAYVFLRCSSEVLRVKRGPFIVSSIEMSMNFCLHRNHFNIWATNLILSEICVGNLSLLRETADHADSRVSLANFG